MVTVVVSILANCCKWDPDLLNWSSMCQDTNTGKQKHTHKQRNMRTQELQSLQNIPRNRRYQTVLFCNHPMFQVCSVIQWSFQWIPGTVWHTGQVGRSKSRHRRHVWQSWRPAPSVSWHRSVSGCQSAAWSRFHGTEESTLYRKHTHCSKLHVI